MSKEIKAAFIGVIGAIIAAIVGAYFGSYFERKADNEDTVFNVYETDEYKSLLEKYDDLNSQFIVIKQENTELQNNEISITSSLNDENKLLIAENNLLKEEIEDLKFQLDNNTSTTNFSIQNDESLDNSTYFYIEINTDNVNIRSEPDASSNIIERLSSGIKIQAFDKLNNAGHDWYKIIINGKVGYVMCEYTNII
jgi:hypothetical protein